jgi:hypothetical protein
LTIQPIIIILYLTLDPKAQRTFPSKDPVTPSAFYAGGVTHPNSWYYQEIRLWALYTRTPRNGHLLTRLEHIAARSPSGPVIVHPTHQEMAIVISGAKHPSMKGGFPKGGVGLRHPLCKIIHNLYKLSQPQKGVPMMEEQALVPVAQTDITIADFLITIVLLPDGQTGAVFAVFCQALDLDIHQQLARLHRDPASVDALVLVALDTPGGPQPTNVIYSWALPVWLASIRAGARPPAYRERLHTIRREAARALAKADLFKQTSPSGTAQPTMQPTPPPAQALPAPASNDTFWEAWQHLGELMRQEHLDTNSRLTVLEEDQHTQHLRLLALESGHARPSIGLSPQRSTHLIFLARQLRQQRGIPVTDTLNALAAHFQSPDAFDLPDTAWPAILTWFENLFAG